LRSHSGEQWPRGFGTHLNQARHDQRAAFLSSQTFDHRDSVISMPILLALAAAGDFPMDWSNENEGMRTLRAVQAFDAEWFTEAFDLTVGRCLASNKLRFI